LYIYLTGDSWPEGYTSINVSIYKCKLGLEKWIPFPAF
jgi:hypothetical protein